MADSKEKLFSDFPPVSTQEWMDKIQVDLKGADYEKKLVWKTNEGFKVKPFYRQEDLEGLKTTDGLPGQILIFVESRKMTTLGLSGRISGWTIRPKPMPRHLTF